MPYIRALQMHSAAHVEYANTLSIMAFRGLNWIPKQNGTPNTREQH
jgi:hypothetical protein